MRTILALLNRMGHKSSNPTMHLPHKVVAKAAGLASSVYRLGIPLLTEEPWFEVTKRWRVVGEDFGPIGGVQQDSSHLTFRWAVLRTAVEDRHALIALAAAQKAHLTFVKSAILSTKPVDFAAGEPVDFAAGEPVDFAAGEPVDFAASIFTFSCQQVLSPSASSPSTAAAASKPSPNVNHATKEEDEEEGQEMPRLTLMPAPQLSIADVLNAKSREDAAVLIRATVARSGGWLALNDQEWVAATIGAIHHAPGAHSLLMTLTGARSLIPTLLERKAQGFTPLALAGHLVSAHLNTDVRNTAAVLRRRLDSIPSDAWHGANGDPNALLTAAQMTDAKHALAARASAPGNRQGTSSRNPVGRDRSSNEGWSKTFG